MSDPELTPQQEEHVRRLLAEARHDEPIPSDVGDRLDRALAGLSRDEPATAGQAPVIDLAARRRRRNAAALLAGAAAVIVAGFGIGQVIDVGGSSSDDAAGGSAAEPVNRDQADDSVSSAEAGDGSGGEVASPPALDTDQPLELSSKHLARDVNAQLSDAAAASGNLQSSPRTLKSFVCATAAPSAYGVGEFFPAYYDGIPAVLAVRPPTGTTRKADVLECGTATELGSVTLR